MLRVLNGMLLYEHTTTVRNIMNNIMNEMSDAELIEYYHEQQSLAKQFDVQQMARKILINSLYGALGNAYFRFYDLRNAEAVTSYGQLAIKWVARDVNIWMNKMCKTSDIDYVIYGDTDSVVGSTEISINGVTQTISDYYDSICDSNVVKDTPKDFVKRVCGDTSPSMNKSLQIEHKTVKYIMKHKVKKRMFKITVGGKSVTVTEDHSVMVLRDGELIDVPPSDIKKGDKLIKLS
jgi:DNA polymerase elongation subunit (family B)